MDKHIDQSAATSCLIKHWYNLWMGKENETDINQLKQRSRVGYRWIVFFWSNLPMYWKWFKNEQTEKIITEAHPHQSVALVVTWFTLFYVLSLSLYTIIIEIGIIHSSHSCTSLKKERERRSTQSSRVEAYLTSMLRCWSRWCRTDRTQEGPEFSSTTQHVLIQVYGLNWITPSQFPPLFYPYTRHATISSIERQMCVLYVRQRR